MKKIIKRIISLNIISAMLITLIPVIASAAMNIQIGQYLQMGRYYGNADGYLAHGVRPAFYLNLSSSSIRSGSGTEANPYTIDGGSGGSADYETAILSYKKIDGKYVINSIARNNTDTAVSAVLYTAVYSDDGRLKGCGNVSADIAANDDTGVDINIGSDVKSGDTVKTYMWSNEMKALSPADAITIQ